MRPTAFLDQGSDEFRARALEKTRSAIWPLAMAIGVGLVVGFAAGYGTALRDRAVRAGIDGNPPAQVASAPAERGGGSSAASADPGAAPTTPDTTPPGRAAMPPSAAAGPGAPAVIPPDGSIEREAPPKREQPPREASSRATTRQDEAKRQAAAAPAGRLLIRSTPAGARVTVDGRDAGVTPATVRELARGPHIVRIAADGYAQEERRIVLTGERMAQSMQFDLVRSAAAGVPAADAAGAGSLTVESRPSGAPVYVDGKLIGTTPLTLESVGSGDHSIGIAQPGYQRWIASVRVTAGERARVTASLER